MTYSYQKKLTARKAMMRRRRIFFSVVLMLIAAGVFLIVMTTTIKPGNIVFYDHIFIDGIDLSGLTVEEARDALVRNANLRMDSMKLKFVYADPDQVDQSKTWADVTPQDLGATLDIDEQLERAYATGHTGSWFTRRAEIIALRDAPYTATLRMTYDESQLRARLYDIKSQIDLPAVDATVEFRPDKEERFLYSKESPGRVADLNAMFEDAKRFMDQETGGTVKIEVEEIAPAVLADELRANTERIVKVTTSVKSSSKARIANIEKALSHYNGLVLQPGEEVSFNQLVGPRTEEAGFQLAAVIYKGDFIDGPGGGVCQASTTLYHAVARAGLEIVERHKHSIPSSYVPVGQDATVDYDSGLDFRFRNNTDFPVYIRAGISGDDCEASVYGRPLPENTTIELVTEEIAKVPAPEPTIAIDVDGTMIPEGAEYFDSPKSRPGYTTRTYRVYYEDDQEIRREELSHDRYRESTGTRYVPVGTITTPPNTDPFAENTITGGG